MKKSLIKATGKIFGGAAIAGMGLSLGRDIYKKAKKNIGLIVLLLIICGLFFGVFSSSVWIARNHRKFVAGFFIRIGSLALWLMCGSSLILLSSFVWVSIAYPDTALEEAIKTFTIDDYIKSVALVTVTTIIGLLTGLIQRKKRKLVWEAEKNNAQFMQEHQLKEYDDGTIEDVMASQNYRVDHLGSERVTLFPLGKRNQRAYIYIDKHGKYSEYTGLTNQ